MWPNTVPQRLFLLLAAIALTGTPSVDAGPPHRSTGPGAKLQHALEELVEMPDGPPGVIVRQPRRGPFFIVDGGWRPSTMGRPENG